MVNFCFEVLAENATFNVYLKSNLVNLINISFAARCSKRIIEVITSNHSQELINNLSTTAERQN